MGSPGGDPSARHHAIAWARSLRLRERSKKPRLDAKASDRLSRRVKRLVCSERWELDVRCMVTEGFIGHRQEAEDQATELEKASVYPPGGEATGMVRCAECGHLC